MKATRIIIGAALTAVAGYVFYEKLLTPEAKASVERLAKESMRGYEKLNDALSSLKGDVIEDPDSLANVQETKQQWAALGY